MFLIFFEWVFSFVYLHILLDPRSPSFPGESHSRPPHRQAFPRSQPASRNIKILIQTELKDTPTRRLTHRERDTQDEWRNIHVDNVFHRCMNRHTISTSYRAACAERPTTAKSRLAPSSVQFAQSVGLPVVVILAAGHGCDTEKSNQHSTTWITRRTIYYT